MGEVTVLHRLAEWKNLIGTSKTEASASIHRSQATGQIQLILRSDEAPQVQVRD